MQKSYYVYILGNKRPTLYIGVTGNLSQRIQIHKNQSINGFASKYGLTKLLYAEQHGDIHAAIAREKQLKHWNRQWKLDLIAKVNPEFEDISNKF